MTGITRSSSSSRETGSCPGRVDSPPTSIRSAPASTIRRAWATARSRLLCRPPSEKESGVTFKMPITRVRRWMGRRWGPTSRGPRAVLSPTLSHSSRSPLSSCLHVPAPPGTRRVKGTSSVSSRFSSSFGDFSTIFLRRLAVREEQARFPADSAALPGNQPAPPLRGCGRQPVPRMPCRRGSSRGRFPHPPLYTDRGNLGRILTGSLRIPAPGYQ